MTTKLSSEEGKCVYFSGSPGDYILSKVSTSIVEEDIDRNTNIVFQNYPNPFNSTTNIKFVLEERQTVSLDIYDLRGQKIRTLINKTLDAKVHTVVWDGSNESDHNVSSGIYICRIKMGYHLYTKKC